MTEYNFSKINKSSAKSFFEHKKLIQKLGQGQTILCQKCKEPLKLDIASSKDDRHMNGIYCKNRCTSIELEID